MPTEPNPPSSSSPSVADQNPDRPDEMGSMFDQVSGRYDLLNSIMSLGQDRAWRRAMWAQVPEEARTVIDLATGNGVSLAGLRRPGRLVIGLDLSWLMLQKAAREHGLIGWAPRLVAGDAFHLPIAGASVDAITIAFGVRNFRPRVEALRELVRVLKPGGRLIVLEAAAPAGGAFAPMHGFYVRQVIPMMGRLSSNPDAYRYLSRSILEFGSGPEFEADLHQAGLDVEHRRSFMLGATKLWVARRPGGPSGQPGILHSARLGEAPRGEMRTPDSGRDAEWRWWTGAQIVIAIAMLATLGYASWAFYHLRDNLPLEPWQRSAMGFLLVAGMVAFVARIVILVTRFASPPPRR